MLRQLYFCAVILFILLLTACAVNPPGPLPPLFGPGLEWPVFLLIAAVCGVWLTRSSVRQFWRRGSEISSSRAWEALRERYAKGEISREEYLRVASDLEVHQHSPNS
jgi:uncharacterized membrane protein